MLTNTASIGNAVLLSALFLQKNHVEYINKQRIDELNTGCYTCKAFRSGSNICEQCPHKVYETYQEKKYINEKNRYGERKLLKRNALLLFIYLHFKNPDKNGLVYFDSEEAAKTLNCNERSIKNNLHLLEENDYIVLNPTGYAGFYKAFLPEYSTYFKKASSGGRGYAVMSSDVFTQLTTMKDINSLRFAIREIIGIHQEIHKPYNEIKRNLPNYCTKKKVRTIAKSVPFSQLFYISCAKRYVSIAPKEEYQNVADKLRADCRVSVENKVSQINQFAETQHKHFKLHINEQAMTDIVNIALKTPIIYICDALSTIYRDYIAHNVPISNLGALVRTISEYHFEIASIA
jgi:hypothetical protein